MDPTKNRINLKRYIGEGTLIMFSVLFALFINKTYEDAKTNNYRDNALNQIKTELTENQRILGEWIEDHTAILENLNLLIESKSDSFQALAGDIEQIPIAKMLNERSLLNEPLLNSAWSSAQSIGIESEFDFTTLQAINQTYELQFYIMESSIDKIAERLFLTSANFENTKKVLIEMRLRFRNLQGQEYRLNQLYIETIEILN